MAKQRNKKQKQAKQAGEAADAAVEARKLEEVQSLEGAASAPWAHASELQEAIAFISATLGDGWTCADACGLYWSACSRTSGYAVWLTLNPELRIEVSFEEAEYAPAVVQKLYAIIGWAHYHDVVIDFD